MNIAHGSRAAAPTSVERLPSWLVKASSIPAIALLIALVEAVFFMSMDWRGEEYDFITGTDVGLFLIALAAVPAVATAVGWMIASRWRTSGAVVVGLGIVGSLPSLCIGIYLVGALILG